MGRRALGLAGAGAALLLLALFRSGAWRAPGVTEPGAPPEARGTAPEVALDPARAVDARREAVPAPAAPAAEAGAADALVRVRSSIGVPLARVEVEQTDGSWQAELLDEGTLSVPVAFLPARLRAPGHLAAELAPDSRELVLEPHTSLVFQAFPLERVESCEPFGEWMTQREAGEAFLRTGACDETSFGLAFDATQLRELIPHLDLTIRFDDGTEARVTHELEAGRHDVYAWPFAPLAVERAPLRVTLARAEPGEGELHVVVRADPNLTREPGKRSLFSEKTPWGSVTVMDYLEQLEAHTTEAELELGPLVLGKPYLLLARDVASGDHDRVFFAHDGSPRQVVLAHGLRLRGTLDLAPAEGLTRLERIVWRFGAKSGGDRYWQGETQDVPVAPDGSFELALPAEVAISERSTFPRPEGLTLELRAGGFESAHLQRETRELRVLELGTVRMAPLPAQLTLAAGHGLVAEDLDYGSVQVPGPDGRQFELSGARRAADGGLELTLQPEEGGGGFVVDAGASEAPWVDVAALVLIVDGEEVAFRSDGLGRYRREPGASFELLVAGNGTLPAEASELEVGWRWEGMDVLVRAWRVAALWQSQGVTFEAPATGAELWWRLDDEPTRAHAPVPLAGRSIVLRVP
jgi:hypothetical protein